MLKGHFEIGRKSWGVIQYFDILTPLTNGPGMLPKNTPVKRHSAVHLGSDGSDWIWVHINLNCLLLSQYLSRQLLRWTIGSTARHVLVLGSINKRPCWRIEQLHFRKPSFERAGHVLRGIPVPRLELAGAQNYRHEIRSRAHSTFKANLVLIWALVSFPSFEFALPYHRGRAAEHRNSRSPLSISLSLIS